MKMNSNGKRSTATLKAIMAAALIMMSAASMSACGEADALSDTSFSAADSGTSIETELDESSFDTGNSNSQEFSDKENDDGGYTDNSTSNYYNSYEYEYEYCENNEYVEYSYDSSGDTEPGSSSSSGAAVTENSSASESEHLHASAEEASPEIDSTYDYSPDEAVTKKSDTFTFELCPAEVTDTLATVSAKVSNPTGAQVAIVGCKLYTPQGALMNEQEYGIDTTDPEFKISFDFTNDGEKLPAEQDYEFQVYISYNGETYTSNYGSFTTLP